MKYLLLIFICFFPLLFVSCDTLHLPLYINFQDYLSVKDLKVIDNRILFYHVNDFNNDSLNDLMLIFDDKRKINRVYWIIALYKNNGVNYKLHYFKEKADDFIWGEKFDWENYELKKIGNYSIFNTEFHYYSSMKLKSEISNAFAKKYFILKGMLMNGVFYTIFKITDNDVEVVTFISDQIKYVIEDNEKKTITFFNINLEREKNDYFRSENYIRKFSSTSIIMENDQFIKSDNITDENMMIIKKYSINEFSEKKDIKSFYELFFFYFYNMRDIVNPAWVTENIKMVAVKSDNLNKLLDLFYKRLALNDEDFGKYVMFMDDFNFIP